MILVVSVSNDIHALAVQHAARQLGYHGIHILECDRIGGRTTLTWESAPGGRACVLTSEGTSVAVEDVDVVWWRRANAHQDITTRASSDHERDLVNNDCRGSLAGILAAAFDGDWVSPPNATTRAGDKIFQLTVAARAGFRVPRTLVSQSKEEVLEFASRFARIIVKPVVGAAGPLMFTQFCDDLDQVPAASFATSPAMYQEYIDGDRHLRVNCFGRETHAALIRTAALDWRPDLNVPITTWEAPAELQDRIRTVLTALELRMGVVDIKLTPEGEPVWLEVNPQGQFLFLEPILGEPLAAPFAAYLVSTANQARSRRERGTAG